MAWHGTCVDDARRGEPYNGCGKWGKSQVETNTTQTTRREIKTMKKTMLCGVLALVGAVMACSASDGANGKDGTSVKGDPGAPGQPGQSIVGPAGEAGAPGQGAKGDQGEPGVSPDASPSLCGDQPMPNWHQPCGADLVGSCADTNGAEWECHLFLNEGQSGDVTQALVQVCADKTSHQTLMVPASVAMEYPGNYAHNPAPVVVQDGDGTRCDADTDCNGVADRLTDTVYYLDSADGDTSVANVKVGDALAISAVKSLKVLCQNTKAVCDDATLGNTGHIVAGTWADAGNSNLLGLDCFNQSTGLEQAMACSLDGTTWFVYTDDNDSLDTCEVLEGEGQISAGTAQVSCVAPPDTQCYN